jgi:hypothetical protein
LVFIPCAITANGQSVWLVFQLLHKRSIYF